MKKVLKSLIVIAMLMVSGITNITLINAEEVNEELPQEEETTVEDEIVILEEVVEELEVVSGGVLPEGWEKMIDQFAPMYIKQYKNVTYDEACKLIAEQLTDKDDQALVFEYIKKFFNEDGTLK